jgi:hypothetical protein
MEKKFIREKPLFRDRPEYKCIGYARQSSNKQICLSAQVEELKKAGCVVVFQETVSSTDKARPQFEAALGTLEEGMKSYSPNCLEDSEIRGSALIPFTIFRKSKFTFALRMG